MHIREMRDREIEKARGGAREREKGEVNIIHRYKHLFLCHAFCEKKR